MLKLVTEKGVINVSLFQLYNLISNDSVSSDIDLNSYGYSPEFILFPLFNHVEPFYSRSLTLTDKGFQHTHQEDIFINKYISSFLAAATDYIKHKNNSEDFISFLFEKCSDPQYKDFLDKYLLEGNTLYSLNIKLLGYQFKMFS